ncbi:phenol 2-monooxygenase [Sphingomonas sp. Root710]|uniref:YHS domain-containing protein n=1 Tax=Sphingomonas sp. Root710 TaxID=1736594 RepID=UPI0006F9F46E|nr:YHS domain-containing protein [Sphingomonas sp. Root710]KRB83911.1 phenol 2-monooxygenase [Sphingomonas sp. Root710]
MDIAATKKKLGLKERYTLMTRGLGWEPTYQAIDDVFPMDTFEGIKIHDWEAWEDPFRLTMDSYWKYQAEKDRKLYAILDAFAQSNGHLTVSDARYINTTKLFACGLAPLEYMSHRGFSHVARQFRGVGPRVACMMQSLDEMRHAQTQIHAVSNYNRYYNGMSEFRHYHDHLPYLQAAKSFFEDAASAGPFEFVIAIGFAFEYVLTNLVFVPFISGAAYNGDMGAMTFGFSAQSDEARHMTLGLEVIRFVLEQDPANVPIVQKWLNKWTWRGVRVITLVAMMQDYMLPKRVMSWAEAWEIYFEENCGALFRDLARYGITMPPCVEQIRKERDHLSHLAWCAFYQSRSSLNFQLWLPSAEDMDWLSAKYPETFDRYYRPRFEYWADLEAAGTPFEASGSPMQCQVCQIPLMFPEPDEPLKLAQRHRHYKEEQYHFCSDYCQEIFDDEPEKYIQAHIGTHEFLKGNCFGPDVDSTAEGFDPLAAALAFWRIADGKDNGLFTGSEDATNFDLWRGLAKTNV